MNSFAPFSNIPRAPMDPILGISEAFSSDTDPRKVNLGVGIYQNDSGSTPIFRAVHRAEEILVSQNLSSGYLPIDGLRNYNQAIQSLLLGSNSQIASEGRAITVQSLGGCGALRIAVELLRTFFPKSRVWISNPSWENHRAVFEIGGFEVCEYPYYDPSTLGLNFTALIDQLRKLPAESIILFHACCHNPTGVDPSKDEWLKIIDVVEARNLIPIIDIAYQGFNDGLEQDAFSVRSFVERGIPCIIANSFSKNFSQYNGRVGGLTVTTRSFEESSRVLSQLKKLIRVLYSNPPAHAARVITTVLTDTALRSDWELELSEMRDRIKAMRASLVTKLKERLPNRDFGFVLKQRGMFTYSGLSKEQVDWLRKERHIYLLETGRICIAALNTKNVDYVAQSIAESFTIGS